MKSKQITTVGFMLFAMFFGAGNLIFPLALGYQSGENFLWSIIGFVVTGVGLPLLGMFVGAITGKGYRQSINEIHPIFSLIFLSAIYLTIGPFFAIPRTGTTAYEIGVVPFLSQADGLSLFLFSAFFFRVTYFVAVKPSKLSTMIGDYLTPALLISIVLLVIRSVMLYWNHQSPAINLPQYEKAPLATGFIEGYLTMDTLASLAFSMIVIKAIRDYQIEGERNIRRATFFASLIAAVLLALIYAALAWIGNHSLIDISQLGNQNLGAFLLVRVAKEGFGSFGVVLISVIVFLACLTTSSGLIAAVSDYFYSIYPRISYKHYAIGFTLISFMIANQGLDQVIQTSVPILSILYPISISIIVLLLLQTFIHFNRQSLLIPILMVTMISIVSVLHRNHLIQSQFLLKLPFVSSQLEWISFLLIGIVISGLVTVVQNGSQAITEK